MWTMIPTLEPIVDDLKPAFSKPSFATGCRLLLAWVMCLGKHTLLRLACNTRPDQEPDHSQRHDLDREYNFFERSSWKPKDLARRLAVLIFTRLKFWGRITLLVDDTLAHKRGKNVWGLGWFRDAVASTKKRVATAPGHNWVVVAVAVCLPGSHTPILALPLLARLHRPGKKCPSCSDLARRMLDEIVGWFPEHRFTLVGDGAYASEKMFLDWNPQVHFVGWIRSDAAVYDPEVPVADPHRPGPKAKKGPRLLSPKQVAEVADGTRQAERCYQWHEVAVTLYGRLRHLLVCRYEVLWPKVLGEKRCVVLVVRDGEGKMRDGYMFCTDTQASDSWILTQYSWRWSIESAFRASKQVMDIEAPQHRSQASVEKVAPWVWSMQSVITVWYLTEGYQSDEAQHLRERMGDWQSEWSLRHMIAVLKRTILNQTFNPNSADPSELRQMVETLKNWVNLAA